MIARLRSWLITILLLPIIFPFLVIIYLISFFRPVYITRFDFGRIGHVYQAYFLLNMRHGQKLKFIDINYLYSSTGVIANKFWLEIFRRELLVIPNMSLFFNKLVVIIRRLHLTKRFIAPFDCFELFNKSFIYLHYPNTFRLLTFNEVDEEKGKRYLNSKNTKPYEYICFFSRDSSYLQTLDRQKDWSYHDYRDSKIKDFSTLVNHYSSQKVSLFRMGSTVKDLYPEENSYINDYSNSPDRSDFFDIFIAAHCKFFILADSGISIVPEIFARPIGFCNVVPLTRFSSNGGNILMIPKRYYKKSEKRIMTFKEIFALGDLEFTQASMDLHDFELIDNTGEEILDLALEIEKKLNKTYQETEEERDLIDKFWLFHPRKFFRRGTFNISGTYLLKNKNLLQ